MFEVGALAGKSGEREESGLRARNLLGKTSSWMGRSAGKDCGGGIGARGTRGESDGANVYGGRVGQVVVPSLVEGGFGESKRELS